MKHFLVIFLISAFLNNCTEKNNFSIIKPHNFKNLDTTFVKKVAFTDKDRFFRWIIDSLHIDLKKNQDINYRTSGGWWNLKPKELYKPEYEGFYGSYFLLNQYGTLGALIVYVPDSVGSWDIENDYEIFINYSSWNLGGTLSFLYKLPFEIGLETAETELKEILGEPDYMKNEILYYLYPDNYIAKFIIENSKIKDFEIGRYNIEKFKEKYLSN